MCFVLLVRVRVLCLCVYVCVRVCVCVCVLFACAVCLCVYVCARLCDCERTSVRICDRWGGVRSSPCRPVLVHESRVYAADGARRALAERNHSYMGERYIKLVML